MEKNTFFSFSLFITLLLGHVVQANIIVPPATEVLLTLVSSSLIVLPIFVIIIGLFLHRRFVLVWHALAIFLAIIFLGFLIEVVGLRRSFVPMIVPAFLYALLLTVPTFISSVLGMRIRFFRKKQEIFERVGRGKRFLVLLISYILLFFPAVYVANTYFPYSIYLILIVGFLLAMIFAGFLLRKLYHDALKQPNKKVTYAKRDYIYFTIIIFFLWLMLRNFVQF